MGFLPKPIFDIIINETKSIIKDDDLREQVKLFEKVLELPVKQKDIEAVGKGLRNTISDVYASLNNYDDCVNYFRNMKQYEEYMKKLLYISNRKQCMELMMNKKLGLGYYMVSLGVFTEELARTLGRIDLESYRYEEDYLYYHILSFQTRNEVSHKSQFFSYVDILQRMQSLLVSMISVTWKYRVQIISDYEKAMILAQSDFDTYCNQIIQEYEDKSKKGFTYTEVRWIQKSFNIDTHNLDNISHEESQVGSIKKLRELCQNERRMLLMGEAGTGKSTSVEYLQYLDAKKYKETNNSPVPVVMKLINITEKTSIEDYIMSVLNITKDVCINMLERGFINLYLDGINEMITNLTVKSQMVNIIENTLHKYPRTYFVITDRIFTDNCINITLPTFTLQPMNWDEICDFIRHNSGNEVIAERVIEVLQQHGRLKLLANTPFKLKQLIQIITTDQSIFLKTL
jgi:hypothetical protein